MSDDQFLHQFRRPPRREFSKTLYERLKQEGEPMTSMMTPLPRPILSTNGIYSTTEKHVASRHTNRWTIAAAVLALIVFGGLLIYMIYPQPEETPLVLSPLQQRDTVISAGSAGNLTEVATLGRGYLNGATWSPDGTLLALFGSMGVWVYDPDDLETPLYHIPVMTNYMAAVYFSPDGSQLIYADQGGLAIWDRATQDIRHISGEDQFSLGVVAFSPDGRLLATGDFEGNIRIWDVATGDLKSEIRVFYNYVPILSMVFNGDSTHLAFTGSDTPVLILEDPTAEWQDFEGDPQVFDPGSRSEAGITSLSFNADGSRVTARVYTEIVVWDTATGEEIARFDTAPEPEPESTAISSGFGGGGGGGGGSAKGGGGDLTFSPDGTQIATVDDSIRIWGITTGEARTLVENEAGDYSSVGYVDFSPDWSRLAIVDPITSELRMIDMATGEVLATQNHHNYRPVMNLMFPDADTLITLSDDTVMRTWDLTTISDESLPTTAVRLNPNVMLFGFQAISISPDRTQYAAFVTNEIEIHDATTGDIIRTLDNPGLPSMYMSSSNLAYSPDGTLLAGIGPQTNIVRLWDVATGELVREAEVDGFAGTVAFSPDGSRLGVTTLPADYYTGAAPGQPVFGVQVFDTATLDTRAALIGHLDTVFQMSFSPDGSQLATYSNDGTLRLWDVDAGQERFMLTNATYTGSFAFSPVGTLLATADYNQDTLSYTIRFWDLSAEIPQPVIALENLGTIDTIAFSPDGTLLAIGYGDGSTQLWAAE